MSRWIATSSTTQAVHFHDRRWRQELAAHRCRPAARGRSFTPFAKTRVKRGLLYAATETGVFVSFDDGRTLAEPAAQSAALARSRPGGQGRRSGGRHPWPLILDSRRRDAIAAGRGRGGSRGPRTSTCPKPVIGSTIPTRSIRARRWARTRPPALSSTTTCRPWPPAALNIDILDASGSRGAPSQQREGDAGRAAAGMAGSGASRGNAAGARRA